MLNALKQIKAEPASFPHWSTRPIIHPHWCHIASTVAYSESLVYCSTLGGAFDCNHWLRNCWWRHNHRSLC